MLLGVEHVDTETTLATLNVLLKYRSDIEQAAKELAATGGR